MNFYNEWTKWISSPVGKDVLNFPEKEKALFEAFNAGGMAAKKLVIAQIIENFDKMITQNLK